MAGRSSRGLGLMGGLARGVALAAVSALVACGLPQNGGRKTGTREPARLPRGARLVKPEGHLAGVNCLSFSPDGRLLVSGSDDGALLVWDVPSGGIVQRLEGHRGFVRACVFLPDGQRVASGGSRGEVFVWDISTGEKRRLGTLSLADDVYSLGVRPDGEEIIAGTVHGRVEAWNLRSGAAAFEKTDLEHLPEGNVVRAAGYLDDGSPFAGGDGDRVLVWGKKIRSIDYKSGSGVPLPGRRLALGGEGEVVVVGPDGKPNRLGEHEGLVNGLAAGPRRDWLLAGDSRGNARVWEVASRTLRCELPRSTGIKAASVDPAGAQMAVGTVDGEILVAPVEACEGGRKLDAVRRITSPRGRIRSVAAGVSVLLGDSTGSVSAWSTDGWSMLGLWPLHEGAVTALTSLPNGGWVSGGLDNMIVAREPLPSTSRRRVGELRSFPYAIRPTPDGASILTADASGRVTQIVLNDGTVTDMFKEKGSAQALAVRPGKQEVVTGGGFPDLRKQTLPPSGEPDRWPKAGEPQEGVTALAYSPDGRWLAEGGTDGTVALRNADTGSIDRRLEGLHDQVSALVVTPEHVWAGGSDAVLARWGLAEASPSDPLRIEEGSKVLDLAATPDGRHLIAGLADGRAAVHALPTGALIAHLIPMRDGTSATLFPDGTFHVSPSGAARDLRFEDPDTRKVVSLGGLLNLSVSPPSVTRAERLVTVRATIFSPSGVPSVRLDGRWPIRGVVPSPTVMAAYDIQILLDDPSGSPHRLDAIAPNGERASVPFRPEPYLRARELRPRALLIGNGTYRGAGDLARLPGALADVSAFERVLRSPESWALDGDRIEALRDLPGVGERPLKATVEAFFARAAKDETLLFYFAGHGLELNGEGYLLPIDHTPSRLNQALSASALWKAVTSSKAARVVVILDACRSGSFAFPSSVGAKLFSRTKRRAFLTAASAMGSAVETAQGGEFTQALLAAMRDPKARDVRREAVTLVRAFNTASLAIEPRLPHFVGDDELTTLPLAWPTVARPTDVIARGASVRTGPLLENVRIDLLAQRQISSSVERLDGALRVNVTFAHPTRALQVSFFSQSDKKRYYAKSDYIREAPPPSGVWTKGERTEFQIPIRDIPPGNYLTIIQPCAPGDELCDKEPPANIPIEITPPK